MSLAGEIASPFDGVRIAPGYADIWPNVKVGGLSQVAAWPSGVYAAPGEPVFVAELVRPDAPAQYVVLGRVGADGPREATVTTVPGGSDTITVTADSVAYTATFLNGYTPTVGDRVRLLWQGRDVTVIGKVGVTPAALGTVGGTAEPPKPVGHGTFNAPATDSATWVPSNGVWDAHAKGGGHLYQGSVNGVTTHGAWFYGNTMAELAGATVTRILFRVPARRSVGNYNAAGTIHLYAHTSPNRPGGDVSRVSGPTNVTIPAGWNPAPGEGWVDLPTSIAATLIAGGGISISGDPYMGFVGKPSDPASGQLRLDWYR